MVSHVMQSAQWYGLRLWPLLCSVRFYLQPSQTPGTYLAHPLKQTRANIIVKHNLRQSFTEMAQCLLEEISLKKQIKKTKTNQQIVLTWKKQKFLWSFILGYVARKGNHPGIHGFCNSYSTVRRCWSLTRAHGIYTNRYPFLCYCTRVTEVME